LWVSGGADGVAVKLAASGGMLLALARWLISSIHIFMNRAPVLADVVALIGCLIDGD